jgi:hypothetical protein
MRKEWKRMFWPAKATWFIPFALFAAIPALLAAQVAIDCPLRDQPYSIDTPLLDLLIKPEAKAALEREAPGLTQSYPPRFTKTEPPTFAAIMTPRSMASYKRILPGGLANLDRALRALPITAEDKQARCSRYDIDPPRIVMPKGKPSLLVFEKITGFRDGPSVETEGVALRAMAERNDWALVFTEKGAAFSPDILKQFDAVIWNNVYNPGEALKMGDHPIAWTQCIGSGRSFYSAIGHRPETYSDSRHVALLERAIAWAAGEGETRCRGVP